MEERQSPGLGRGPGTRAGGPGLGQGRQPANAADALGSARPCFPATGASLLSWPLGLSCSSGSGSCRGCGLQRIVQRAAHSE